MTEPEEWAEIGRVELILCLDENGDTRGHFRYDDGVTAWSAVGMMTDFIEVIKTEWREA